VFVWDRCFSTDEQSVQQIACVCKSILLFIFFRNLLPASSPKGSGSSGSKSTVSEALPKQAEAAEASYILLVRK